MIRNVWILFFLSIVSSVCSGQTIKKLEEAEQYQKDYAFEKALSAAQEAYHDAHEINDVSVKFDVSYRLASIFIDLHDFKEAYKNLLELKGFIEGSVEREHLYNTIMSKMFDKMKHRRKSLSYKLKCLEYDENSFSLSSVGSLYLKLGIKDSAILFYNKQINLAVANKYEVGIAKGYNNLGFAYSYLEEMDSATFFYKKALDFISPEEAKTNQVLFSTIHGNVGLSLVKLKRYSESIDHLLVDFRYSLNKNLYDNSVMVGSLLCEAYIELEQIGKVNEVLDQLRVFRDKLPLKWSLMLMELEIKYFEIVSNSHELSELVLIYTDSVNARLEKYEDEKKEISDVLVDVQLKTSELELASVNTKFNEAKEQSLQNERMLKNKLFLAGIFILLSIVILIVWNRNKRNQLRIDELVKENEKNKLEIELQNKKSDLTDLAISTAQRKEFYIATLTLVQEVKNASNEEKEIKLRAVESYINQQRNSVEIMELTQENVEDIGNDFFERLSAAHTTLTPKEKEVCALIRLNLSNKEISNLKNISVQSSRTLRYRIKKKLNLSKEVELTDYLQGF